MDFYDRFELLELVRDDGVKTFEAREVATGRPVRVHLFVAPKAPLQAALLKALDWLPEEEAKRIIDRGKNEGTPYIVTDRLLDHTSLQDWVINSTRHGRPGDVPSSVPTSGVPTKTPGMQEGGQAQGNLGNAGAWKIQGPVVLPAGNPHAPTPETAPEQAAAGAPRASGVSAISEFTRMFQSPPVSPAAEERRVAAPSVDLQTRGEDSLPEAEPPHAGASTQTGSRETPQSVAPSEFTKMFETPGQVASKFPQHPTLKPASEPGEFTRMFQASDALPTAIKPAEPAPRKFPEQGEFTRMFQAPAPVSPPPGVPQNLSSGPGEFTRMFQGTPSPASLRQEALVPETSTAPPGFTQASAAGEFTRFFETPTEPLPVALQPPVTPQANPGAGRIGEFTRMFGQGELPANPSVPPDSVQPPKPQTGGAPVSETQGSATQGNATQAFSVQGTSVNPGPAVSPSTPSGPGEYTRMFTAPAELTLGQTPGSSQPLGSARVGGGLPIPGVSIASPQVSGPQISGPQVSGGQVSGPQLTPPSYSGPSMGQMNMPSASIPQSTTPADGGAASPSRNLLPLILGIVGLLVLALLIIAIFAMGKH